MSGDEKLRQKVPEMLPQMLTNVSFVYTSTKGRDLQQKCSEEELDHFYDLIAIISADGDWDSINNAVHPLGSRLHYLCDLQGLDAFHHAILAHNMTAIHYFHHYNLFSPPHNPEINPYLHLAANVGFATAIRTLQQVHPCDFIRRAPLQIPYYLLKGPLLTMVRKKFTGVSETSISDSSAEGDAEPGQNPEIPFPDAENVSNEGSLDGTASPTASPTASLTGSLKAMFNQCDLKDSGYSESRVSVESTQVPDADSATPAPQTTEEEEKAEEEERLEEEVQEKEKVEKTEVEVFEENKIVDHPEAKSENGQQPLDEPFYNNFLHNMYMEDRDLLVRFESMTPADHAVHSRQVEALEALLTAKHHMDLVAAAASYTRPGRRRRSEEADHPSSLELAAKSAELFHSPAKALRLLLETFTSRPTSGVSSRPPGLNEALLVSIHDLRADCVRVLAEYGADQALAWGGRNCLHYLYSYTFGTAFSVTNKSVGYLETTRALVECLNVPVNCAEPLGSHPLYAFLNQMGDIIADLARNSELPVNKPSLNTSPVLQTIQYLLEAGANPNLNELSIETERSKTGQVSQPMYGRSLFPSALAAFYASIPSIFMDEMSRPSRRVRSYYLEFELEWIFTVTKLLADAGARVEDYNNEKYDIVGNMPEYAGYTFNSFLLNAELYREHNMVAGTPMTKTLLLLLRCGVNLNEGSYAHLIDWFSRLVVRRVSWIIFVLNHSDAELRAMSGDRIAAEEVGSWRDREPLSYQYHDQVAQEAIEYSDLYHCIVIILDHIALDNARKLIDNMVTPPPETGPIIRAVSDIRKAIVSKLAEPVMEARTLTHSSAMAAWALAGRDEGRLEEMNLPSGLSNLICRSFEPGFYGLGKERYCEDDLFHSFQIRSSRAGFSAEELFN